MQSTRRHAALPKTHDESVHPIPGAQRRGTWGIHRLWGSLLFSPGTWASPQVIVAEAAEDWLKKNAAKLKI
jgi:hypothetical protein